MLKTAELLQHEGLFQKDACVIEEQPDHLVVAVRIPKSTIQQNHPLMLALSDLSGPDRLPPRSNSTRMARKALGAVKQSRSVLVASIVAGCAGALMSTAVTAGWPWRMPPPIETKAMRAEPARIKVGQELTLIALTRRSRQCAAQFDRMVIRKSDGVTVWTGRSYGGAAPITTDFRDYPIVIRFQSPLPPGKYTYRGFTHSECSRAQGGDYDEEVPPVEFEIVD